MSLPVMIFRHLLVSSRRRTGTFLEGITYHMTINIFRVPPKSKFFKVTKHKMEIFWILSIFLFFNIKGNL